MDMSLSKLQETVKDKEARHAAIRGVIANPWLNKGGLPSPLL